MNVLFGLIFAVIMLRLTVSIVSCIHDELSGTSLTRKENDRRDQLQKDMELHRERQEWLSANPDQKYHPDFQDDKPQLLKPKEK